MSKLIFLYEKNIEIKSFQSVFMNFNFLLKLAKEFSGLKENQILLQFHLEENQEVQFIRDDKDVKKFIEILEDKDLRIQIVQNNKENNNVLKFEDDLKKKEEIILFNKKDILDDIKIERIQKINNLHDDNADIHKMLKKFKRLKISGNLNKKTKKIKKMKKTKMEKIKKKNKKLKKKLLQVKSNLNDIINSSNSSKNDEISNYKYQIEKILEQILKKEKKNNQIGKNKNNKLNIKTIHNNVACNSCEILPIIGKRFKCMICYNFDFCENCEIKLYHPHPMIRMVEKIDNQFSNYIDKLNFKFDKKKDKIIEDNLVKQKKELLEFMFGSITNTQKNELIEKYPDLNIEEFYKVLTKI